MARTTRLTCPVEDELCPKDRAWISRYMVHFNGARASREINCVGSPKRHAARMMIRPLVEEEIHRLLAVDNAQFMGARHAVIKHLLSVVQADPSRLTRQNGSLRSWAQIDPEDRAAVGTLSRSEYRQADGTEGSKVTVKLKNSIQAAQTLMRLMGWDRKADEGDIGADHMREAAESLQDTLTGMLRPK
jgi:hypothetical protein